MNTDNLTNAAAALGRKGGAAKSEAKAQAARKNGRKGGRPRLARRLEYQIKFQTGAAGSKHRTIRAAAAALRATRARARKNGDEQAIALQVNIYQGGRFYGVRDLTEAEHLELVSCNPWPPKK